MASWGILFDRQRGHILDEFDAVFLRSWGINMVGECIFTLPVKDPKNTLVNFQFGNHLVICNDDGLPPWSGRLETPRGWGNKTNKHRAVSHESFFFDRVGKTKPDVLLKPAGNILRQLIKIANAEEDTLMRPGDIYNGGSRCGAIISAAVRLSDNLDQILEQSGYEYEIAPVVANNRFIPYVNLYAEQGVDTGASLNDSNCRIDENSLSEVGPIQNWLVGVGKEEQETRNYYVARDPLSRDRYGLRQAPYEVDVVEAPAVKALTIQQLAVMKQPRRTFCATASNVGDLYPLLRKGNRLQFESAEYGYGTGGVVGTQVEVRIMGMAYSDDIDGVALTIQESHEIQ